MQAKEENTTRRDELLRIQEEAQRAWADEKVFEIDAPPSGKIPGPSSNNFESSSIQSNFIKHDNVLQFGPPPSFQAL